MPGPGSRTGRPSRMPGPSPTDFHVRLRRREGRSRRGLLQRLHFGDAPGGAARDSLPPQQADILGDEEEEEAEDSDEHKRALWIYEPDPEEILARLVPDYVEISIYRRCSRSTASEHGARMSAMRSARQRCRVIDDLTLEANRQRQAEITQEIMEVVAGAEDFDKEGRGWKQAPRSSRSSGRTGDGGTNVGTVEEVQGVVPEVLFPLELPRSTPRSRSRWTPTARTARSARSCARSSSTWERRAHPRGRHGRHGRPGSRHRGA